MITPAKRKQAAALVKDGVSVSLGVDAETEKAIDNPRPYEHTMTSIGTDKIAVEVHSQGLTHLDSLPHHSEQDKYYNGYAPTKEEVMKANGHARNSIYNVRDGILTRGVLFDIARLKGVPYLEPGTPIYVEDLEAWEKQAGVRVSAGDAMFVHTGAGHAGRRWALGASSKIRRGSIRRSYRGLGSAMSR